MVAAPVNVTLMAGWCLWRHHPTMTNLAMGYLHHTYPDGTPYEALTNRSFAELGVKACPQEQLQGPLPLEPSVADPALVHAPAILVRDGRSTLSLDLRHSGNEVWRGAEIAKDIDYIELGFESVTAATAALWYSISVLPVVSPHAAVYQKQKISHLVSADGVHGHMAHTETHSEKITLVRASGNIPLPSQGFLKMNDDVFSFVASFSCAGVAHSYEAFMMIKLSNLESGIAYDNLLLPFTKQCGMRSKSSLRIGFGTDDDLGHLGAALPLGVYSVWLFCFYAFQRESATHIFFKPITVAQDGMLETMLMLISGFLGLTAHMYSITRMFGPGYISHELFHLLGHGFGLALGTMSLALRCLRTMTDATFPVYIVFMSILLNLHSQHDPTSASVHFVYSLLLFSFGILRFLALYNVQLTLFASFLGLWAAIVLLLSARSNVEAFEEHNLGAADAGMASGMLSAAIVASIILVARACHYNTHLYAKFPGAEDDIEMDQDDMEMDRDAPGKREFATEGDGNDREKPGIEVAKWQFTRYGK